MMTATEKQLDYIVSLMQEEAAPGDLSPGGAWEGIVEAVTGPEHMALRSTRHQHGGFPVWVRSVRKGRGGAALSKAQASKLIDSLKDHGS